MQIKSADKSLAQLIKVVKFAWRHFFVSCVFTLLLISFINYPVIEWQMFGWELLAAIALDYLKRATKLKNSLPNQRTTTNSIASFTEQNYWNSSIVGTTNYLSSINNRYK